jgi:catechol 2,3-dioxygenase-like lactoylglutathione lyase family enzyme
MLEYTGLRVRDLDRARRFYAEGLGLRPTGPERVAAGGTRETLVDDESGARLELNFYPDAPPYREGSELDHLAFRVPRLEAALERLVALGGRVQLPPFADGATRAAFISDPDGIWVRLFERTGPDTAPTSQPVD